MSTENLIKKIEGLRAELITAVGKLPIQPREVPLEFRRKVLALMAGGASAREISKAIEINESNFYQWRKDTSDSGKLEEVRVTQHFPKITISDPKIQFFIEGLTFDEIIFILRERIF